MVRPVGVAPPPEPAVVEGTSVVAVAVAVGCPPPAPVLNLVSDSPAKTIRSASPIAGALLADLTRLAAAVGGPGRQASGGSDDALCERSAIWRSNSLVRLDIAGTSVGVWVGASQDNGQQAQNGVAEVHGWIFL